MLAAPTLAARIDALVEVATGIAERVGALFEVSAQAESLEPEIARAAQAGRESTARLCATFWAAAAADGLLPMDANIETLACTTDVLVCADTLVHLRRTGEWSAHKHATWLRATRMMMIRSST